MAVIEHIDVKLSGADVLQRLPLAAPAFAARPAAALVTGILDVIRQQRLITPRASFRCLDVRHGGRRRVELADGGALELARPVPQLSRTKHVLAVAWSLGPDVSRAVSAAFRERRGLHALLLDEIASLIVLRLGEEVFGRLRQRFAARGLCVGRPLAPGDGALALTAQGPVLELAGARRIGVGLGSSGVMSPLKTATAVAAVGRHVRPPQRDWSCAGCAGRAACRLRSDHVNGTGHGDTVRG